VNAPAARRGRALARAPQQPFAKMERRRREASSIALFTMRVEDDALKLQGRSETPTMDL